VYIDGRYEPAGRSLEEAQVRQGELKKIKASGGTPILRSKATFREVAEEWFAHAQRRPKRPLRPSTAKEYRRYLDGFLLPRFGDRRIGSIQVDDIERLIDELHAKALSESTISNHLRPLAGTLRYAVRNKRVISVNPMDQVSDDYRVSSNTTREHREWTTAEIDRVIAAARANDARKESRRPYALAIEVLLRCGLRLGECLGLRFDDIDFEQGVLHVRRSWNKDNTLGPPKTATSNRRVTIPAATLGRLATASLGGDDEDFVFSVQKGANPPSQSNFRRRGWDPAIEAAGLTDGPRTTPHSARHAFASQLAALQVSSNDLAPTLGHSTIRTTERTYVHAFARDEREARIRAAQDAAMAGAQT
jgi:integrase